MQLLYRVSIGHALSNMYRCEFCFSARIEPKLNDDVLLQFYKRNYFTAAKSEVKKARILSRDYFKKVHAVNGDAPFTGRALEIGAGYGFFAELFSATTGTTIDVVEISQSSLPHIYQKKHIARVYQSVYDIPEAPAYSEIFCFHVIEHLQETGSFLQQVGKLLCPGGRVWFLTPNAQSFAFIRLGESWGWACPEQHVKFLSQSIPDEYFEKLGFKVFKNLDLLPACMHFPSYWREKIMMHLPFVDRSFSSAGAIGSILSKFYRRIVRKLMVPFEQNRTNFNLCRLEMVWAKVARRRPYDELLLILLKP